MICKPELYFKKTLKITGYFSFWPSGKYTEDIHRYIKRLLTNLLKHYFASFLLGTSQFLQTEWLIQRLFPFLFYQGRWTWLEQILSSVPGIVLLSGVFNRLVVSAHTVGQPLISSGSHRPPVCSERWGEVERFFWDCHSIASCYHVWYFSWIFMFRSHCNQSFNFNYDLKTSSSWFQVNSMCLILLLTISEDHSPPLSAESHLFKVENLPCCLFKTADL